jgi:hypothetical protein
LILSKALRAKKDAED